ncbi:MAG: TIGR01212 family radical SAM protein [Eubacterium sp.]
MTKKMWGEKPYHSLDYEMKHRFGEKVYKISLDGGLTCPNRDGTLDTRGCIFCSENGSGDFATPRSSSVTAQISHGIEGISKRKHVGHNFIAYFQSFTNTYGSVSYLEKIYKEALAHPDVVMLSIATRPDCLPPEVLQLLDDCNRIKPIMVELGLQTSNESTARFIRRGYPLDVYDNAVSALKSLGIEVVTHVIAGLPGETKEDFFATLDHVAACHSDGIKIQLLHIIKGTDLACLYEAGKCSVLSQEEYIELVLRAIALLPPEMTIHRLTGDGPKDLLLAPLWSSRKRDVLNEIHRQLKQQDIWQGKEYKNHE